MLHERVEWSLRRNIYLIFKEILRWLDELHFYSFSASILPSSSFLSFVDFFKFTRISIRCNGTSQLRLTAHQHNKAAHSSLYNSYPCNILLNLTQKFPLIRCKLHYQQQVECLKTLVLYQEQHSASEERTDFAMFSSDYSERYQQILVWLCAKAAKRWLRKGRNTRATLDLCIAIHRRGCRVCLLFDFLNSSE